MFSHPSTSAHRGDLDHIIVTRITTYSRVKRLLQTSTWFAVISSGLGIAWHPYEQNKAYWFLLYKVEERQFLLAYWHWTPLLINETNQARSLHSYQAEFKFTEIYNLLYNQTTFNRQLSNAYTRIWLERASPIVTKSNCLRHTTNGWVYNRRLSLLSFMFVIDGRWILWDSLHRDMVLMHGENNYIN